VAQIISTDDPNSGHPNPTIEVKGSLIRNSSNVGFFWFFDPHIQI